MRSVQQSSHSTGKSGPRLAAGLTVIGLAWGSLTLVLTTWSDHEVQVAQERARCIEETARQALSRLDTEVLTGQRRLADLLDDTNHETGASGWTAAVGKVIDDLAQDPEFQGASWSEGPATTVIDSFHKIDSRASEWRNKHLSGQKELAARTIAARDCLRQMREAIDREAGSQRLARIMVARRFHDADAELRLRLASDLVGEAEKPNTVDSLRAELAELEILVERLVAETSGDELTDLKDNKFGPSIARLWHLLGGGITTATPLQARLRILLDPLETMLFGSGFVNLTQQQTITPGVGGLFVACSNDLRSEAERKSLANEARTSFRVYTDLRRELEGTASERVRTVGDAVQQRMSSIWRAQLVLFLVCAACFVLLGIGTARMIRHQMLELERSERLVRTILASAADGIVGFDAQERASFSNPAGDRLLGRAGDRLLGCTFSELFDSRTLASLGTGPGEVVEYTVTRPDGTQVVCELTSASNAKTDGAPACMVVSMRDVTQHKELQGQLASSQKLEAIGQLAAGIAHEINTPTQYIGDNIRFLRDAFVDISKLIESAAVLAGARSVGDKDAAVTKLCALVGASDYRFWRDECPVALTQSLDGVERVTKIVHSMKEYSHPDRNEAAPVDLNQVITSATTVCRNEWRYIAQLRLELDPDLPMIRGFAGALGQVVLNLVVNAAHAIGENRGSSEFNGQIVVRSRVDNDSVLLQVEDSGAGIAEKVKPRIFEQFFTTKEVGKGTGQGLSLVRRIVVDKHGGKVWFESTVGKGTTFFVRLPVSVRGDVQASVGASLQSHTVEMGLHDIATQGGP